MPPYMVNESRSAKPPLTVCVKTSLCARLDKTSPDWVRPFAANVTCLADLLLFTELRDHGELVNGIEITDYTGPEVRNGTYDLANVQLDVQAYVLHPEHAASPQRRSIKQTAAKDDAPSSRILNLPNAALHDAWNSLVFDDALPARLLRYLVRMVTLMSEPDLNLSTFNWNRLCLLHGPPGSGKSTLCRALAQKLSIRLGDAFTNSVFVEINTNSMLSKYFGESGKLIGAMFERIFEMAQCKTSLVCIVMDEVETIAGSRTKSTSGGECSDGLRATNQLLTALDRLRDLPNVIVLCTSNLIEAIDPAFLDRVDIKQLIPSPSPAAIYNIFRSCLNELVRSHLVDPAAAQVSARDFELKRSVTVAATPPSKPTPRTTRSAKSKAKAPVTPPTKAPAAPPSSSTEPWTVVLTPLIPTFAEMMTYYIAKRTAPGARVWDLARKCEGFSGRTLRRLPILGLAMYTWGGNCSLDDAVSALEAAVEQELLAKVSEGSKGDADMGRA